VDADYSSTAAFYDSEDYSVYKAERVLNPDRLIKQLEDYREKRGFGKNNSGLNSLRNHVYRQCEKAGRELPVGLYTLTAPTGTGKTHALIKFALEQAKRNNQKRIFVVLPYLSI
jgi:CRISPR-associated endonuclease/helicase Cas3